MAGEQRFFVTGLPRSRTAWLARLFSYGASYCLHDAMIYADWRERIDALPFAAQGLSDSGLALMPSVPAGRWLIVRRDPAECLRSFLAMPQYPGVGPIDPHVAAKLFGGMLAGLDALEAQADSRVVKYGDLDDEGVMRSTWNWLLGDVQPFSDTHWQEMRHMRVTVRPDTYEVN
jgi:hypothetical protein